MKTRGFVITLFVVALAFAPQLFTASAEAPASARSEVAARLIVPRVANFGTFNFLNLFVDGVYVANLGYLRSYEAVLPPGRHVLSVSPELEYCTHTIVNAEPGRTYAFTARWQNNHEVYLVRGDGASKQIVAEGMPPAATSCGPGR